MLRNNELRELTRQLNKNPRTSLLNEEERKAITEGITDAFKEEITKEIKKKGRPKKEKTNE